MSKRKLSERLEDGLREAKAIDRGEATAGRVWVVKRRPEGTVERRQVDPESHRRERVAACGNDALAARGKLGLSQDRCARRRGTSAGIPRG